MAQSPLALAFAFALGLLGFGAREAAGSIEIRGVVGKEAIVNGVYELDGENHNYPCYRNTHYKGKEGLYLCVDAHGYWAVQPETEMERQSANVYIHSAQLWKAAPIGAGPWMRWDPAAAGPD